MIRNLSNTHAKESLKKLLKPLLKPLLEYEDLPPQLYGAHDEYLTALVVNQVQEALPYLRDMQADLTELNEISLREDGADYEFAPGIRKLVVTRAGLGEDISLLQTQVESARVPLPDFITPLLRQTIVEAWGNNNDRGTDIRWLTEYLLTVPKAIQQAQNETVEMSVNRKISASGVMTVTTTPVQSDKPESSQPAGRYQPELQIESLVKALKQDSIKIEEVIDYADEMSQGYSTYYLIKMPIDDTEVKVIHEDGINETATSSRRDRLNISKLGPFSYYERHEEIEYVSNDDSGAEEPAISGIYTTIDDDQNHSAKYKKAIENSGFISLSDKQLLFIIPSLNIRNFGDSKPLTVAELLFYWQD